jgi:hypothetical protein
MNDSSELLKKRAKNAAWIATGEPQTDGRKESKVDRRREAYTITRNRIKQTCTTFSDVPYHHSLVIQTSEGDQVGFGRRERQALDLAIVLLQLEEFLSCLEVPDDDICLGKSIVNGT